MSTEYPTSHPTSYPTGVENKIYNESQAVVIFVLLGKIISCKFFNLFELS